MFARSGRHGKIFLVAAATAALAGFGFSSLIPNAHAAALDATQYQTSDFVMQDYFDRTVTSGLGTSMQGGAYQVISGNFSVANSEAAVTSLSPGKTAKAVLPAVNVADVSVRKSLIVPTVRTGTNGLWDAVETRYQTDGSSYREKVAILNNGSVDVGISRVLAGSTETILGSKSTGITLKSGQKLRYEARVSGTTTVSVAVRAWVDGAPEPAWQLVVQDSSTARISHGGAVALWSYASSAAPAPFNFSHSSWTATNLVAPIAGTTTTTAQPATPTTAKPTTTTVKPATTTTTAKPVVGLPAGDIRSIVSSAGANANLQLAAGAFTFNDFQSNAWGVELKGDSLRGAGIDSTIIRMNPRTSTKAGMVPTAAGTTNQLSLILATGSPTLSGFTLQATDQGHLYNGLRVSQTTNAKISNVKVTGVPGNSSSPPGETFAINDYRSNGNVYSNIYIDGANIGAAAFGINSSSNITINGLTSINNKYSHGITFWQTNNATLNDFVSDNNHKAINFEQNTGTFYINRPSFGTSSTGMDLSVFSNISSNKIIITDPKLVAGQKIRIRPYIGATAYNGVNKQVKSDIKVLVNGVDKTNELVQWL